MKKYLFALTLFFALAVSQAAFASDWRPVDGSKDVFWNAEGLKYITDNKGNKIDGDLVVVSVRRPMSKEVVQKLADSQTDAKIKAEVLQTTHEVRNFCYSLSQNKVSYVGAFLVTKDEVIVGQQEVMSDFTSIPSNTAVEKIYNYLKAEAAAGRIK